MKIIFVNEWIKDDTFNSFSLIDISYECVSLDDNQHTLSFFFMGLGVWIFWHTNYDITL